MRLTGWRSRAMLSRYAASAVFYTKLHDRLLRPLTAAADQPAAPIQLQRALTSIDRVIADHVTHARLGAAA